MPSTITSKDATSGGTRPFPIGERLQMEGRDGEFVVVKIDNGTGRVELLQLSPGAHRKRHPLFLFGKMPNSAVDTCQVV